ncbi:MAG: helix-turn-helix domain-containing protein [Peptoniphilaceae bacterium]
MENFEDLVKIYVSSESMKENSFNPLGKYYYANTETYSGYYWYYESHDFIIDIHNFFIKKDFVDDTVDSMGKYVTVVSNFVISGNGEWFNPYQAIEPFSIFLMDPCDKKNRYLIHGNSRFFLVGIKFKKTFFKKHYPFYDKENNREDLIDMFLYSKNLIVKPISKIAKEILTCKLEKSDAKIFFEEKAKEWFFLTIKANENSKNEKVLSAEDERLIENVAKYINDHYSYDIPQVILEKIACMGGTKLKETFKKKYNLNITEFTQRKRMNIAEQLLLNTDLEIKYIAKTVGYNSTSRFSKLYKRYKGIYPREVKNIFL